MEFILDIIRLLSPPVETARRCARCLSSSQHVHPLHDCSSYNSNARWVILGFPARRPELRPPLPNVVALASFSHFLHQGASFRSPQGARPSHVRRQKIFHATSAP